MYAEVVRRAACDPDIAQVNVFGFRDDAARAGFQAGSHRVDGTPRPSADAVRTALASGVPAPRSAWTPARGPYSAQRGRESVWSGGG